MTTTSGATIVQALAEYDAFVHTVIEIYDIVHLYVPFQDMTDERTEDSIRSGIERSHRIIVRADTGMGKTCAVNCVISKLMEKYFPIVLSPFLEDTSVVCSSIEEFTKFVLSQTYRTIEKFIALEKEMKEKAKEALSGKVSYVEGKKAGITGRLRGVFHILPFIATVESGLGSDLQEYTKRSIDEKIYNTQRINCLKELCETIEAHGKRPIFCIEDTDKFLKRADLDLSGLTPKFFGQIFPSLAQVGRPLVVLAHDYYTGSETYKWAENNYVDTVVRVPTLDYEAHCTIIGKRIKAVSPTSTNRDVFDEDALTKIFAHYREDPKIRRSILLCRECAERASDRITSSLVDMVKAMRSI